MFGVPGLVLDSQYKRDMDILEKVQWRVAKWKECPTCEERLRELCLFFLGLRGIKGYLINVYRCLIGGVMSTEWDTFVVPRQDKRQWTKWKSPFQHFKFKKTLFYYDGCWILVQVAWRGCGEDILEDIQSPTRHNPGPLLWVSLLEQGWDLMDTEGSTSLTLLWFCKEKQKMWLLNLGTGLKCHSSGCCLLVPWKTSLYFY